MLEIVGTFASKLEYYSIDEFFFETEPLHQCIGLVKTALTIRDRVLEKVGLPVTIGVARISASPFLRSARKCTSIAS